MHRRVSLFLVTLASLSVAHAQTDWRFAQPDADLRMNINLQAVLKSPTVTELIAKAKTGPPNQAAQVQFALGLLSSIDRISISARQIEPTAATPSKAGAAPRAGAATKDADVLALVTGTFDPASLQSFFPSTGSAHVKQVGPHTILIGEGASFTRALQRMQGDAAPAPFDELEQSDIWFAGNPARLSAQQATPVPVAFQPMRAFSFGINLGPAADLTAIFTAADAAGAAKMLSSFREMLTQFKATPQAATLLEQALQIKQDGARVRLHFLAPPELMQFAQTQAAATPFGSFSDQLQPLMKMMGMGTATGTAQAPMATFAPSPAPPSNGGKIMIYGLDEGPREVKTK